MIQLKRAYDPPEKEDGFRILVERLWPRGVRKEDAQIDLWIKDLAPSTELRKWYGHDPDRWPEFKQRYAEELRHRLELVQKLRDKIAEHETVTFVFAARDEARNSAVVLKEFLEGHV